MASYYCYTCLRKVWKRQARLSTLCPICQCEMRCVKTNKTRAQVVTRLARLRGIKPPSRKTDYEQYCASKEWVAIRTRILDRDNCTCLDCNGHAVTVHHLSYSASVMAGEDDSQLISLCVPCHWKRHPKHCKSRQRKRRKRDERLANTAISLPGERLQAQL